MICMLGYHGLANNKRYHDVARMAAAGGGPKAGNAASLFMEGEKKASPKAGL
jgi:hypothetical protein